MNVIKTLEKICRVREEMNKISRALEHQQNELDKCTHEIIEYLKMKRLVESRTVK